MVATTRSIEVDGGHDIVLLARFGPGGECLPVATYGFEPTRAGSGILLPDGSTVLVGTVETGPDRKDIFVTRIESE